MSPTPPEPVAIIGMGCRFPGGADSPEKLWEILCQGKDCFVDIPPDRWDNRKYYDPDPDKPGKISVRQGGFLKESIFDFDPEFFGISPREAETMDPQQRLLLEVTWEALEDSGLTLPQIQSLNTGVFMGAFHLENYSKNMDSSNTYNINNHTAVNIMGTMLSNKISYLLNLSGPSLSIDTACSSSLSALHLAVQSIRNSENEIAVAGGINCILNPSGMIVMTKGHFFSDRSRAFGINATGYGRGEGAGVLLLKPLKTALKDGNNIHAIIRHSKLNQDGHTPGITLPNREAQARLMTEVYKEAKVNSKDIRYFEAHGTGTDAGDKAEAWSINKILSKGRSKKNPIYAGSIKTNIGHLEAAAGVAGVIKATLILKHREIPSSLHSSILNPEIPFQDMMLEIPQKRIPLPGSKHKPAYVGVNSFGYGGTNAHILLESSPIEKKNRWKRDLNDRKLKYFLAPFSAKHPKALRDLASRYAVYLTSQNVLIEDFCHSLAYHRTHHNLRAAIFAQSKADLARQFKNFSEGVTTPTIVHGSTLYSSPKILFVYPGVGPQWFAMGRELWNTQPVYKMAVLECDKHFQKVSGYSIVKELLKNKSSSKINRAEILQPAITVVQIGLTQLWKSWGLQPDAIVGHSLGEIAAAQASGAISLPTAMKIVAHRAKALKKLAGSGGMLSVNISREKAKKLIAPYRSKVSIAAINDFESVTLSGDLHVLKDLSTKLNEKSIYNQLLKVDIPYHSPATDQIIPTFRKALKNTRSNKPHITLYSSLLGRQIKSENMDANYWSKNIRQPVSFHKTLLAIAKDPVDVVIEVGPHPVLKNHLQKTLSSENPYVLPTIIRKQPENLEMLTTLSKLFTIGSEIKWNAVIPGGGRFISLPYYPWQRNKYWEKFNAPKDKDHKPDESPFLQRDLYLSDPTWEAEINNNFFPFLSHHKIHDEAVFPASGYIDGLFSLTLKLDNNRDGVTLENLAFENILAIQPSKNHLMHLKHLKEQSQTFITSTTEPSNGKWILNVKATLADSLSPPTPAPEPPDLTTLSKTFRDVYAFFGKMGLQYGRFFQVIKKVHYDNEMLLVYLAQSNMSDIVFRYTFLIDGIFQAIELLARLTGTSKLMVPRKIKCIKLYRKFPKKILVQAKLVWGSKNDIIANVLIWDDKGSLLGEMDEVHLTHISVTDKKNIKPATELIYAINFGYSNKFDTKPAFSNKSTFPNEASLLRHIKYSPVELRIIDHNTLWAEIKPPILSIRNLQDIVEAILVIANTVVSKKLSCIIAHSPINKNLKSFKDGHIPAIFAIYSLLQCLKRETSTLGISLSYNAHVTPSFYKLKFKKQNYIPVHTRIINVQPTPQPTIDTTFEQSNFYNLNPDEIKLKIFYSAINFKDILKAAHRLSYPDSRFTYTGYTLGIECGGVIQEVGKNIKDFKKGDFVAALAPRSLSSYLILEPKFVLFKINTLSLQKNLVYLPFLTAYYGLCHLAQTIKGEKVLIHNATGAVGLAAIQIAKWLGAEIFATAGNREKLNYLSKIGIKNTYSSRTTDFHAEIKRSSRGVDVVIGAVQDELLNKSFDLLLSGGRYIELGKKNISNNSGLPMQIFDRNVSFFGVDLDRLAREKPQIWHDLLKQIHEKLEQGIFKPLPTTVFPASKIKDAFTYMAQAKHIGRILIDWQNQKVPVTPTLEHDVLKPNATYIITGGLGGFGLEVSRWLVENGAKYVVPLSRSGPKSPEAKEAVAWMKKQGAEVKALSIDISDIKQVRRMMQSIKKDFPEVRGVIHCAGVLDDKLAVDIDRKSLEKVFAPKVGGALNLHEATLGMPLDFFVCFSSIVSIVGNVGQANYAAANGFLDGFAPYRRSLGLPCTTINWGAIGETGMVAKDKNVEKQLAQAGIRTIPIKDALEALGKVMLNDLTNVGVFDIDWATWTKVNPKAAKSPFFSEVLKNITKPGQNGSTTNGFAAELQEHVKKGGKALDFSLNKLSKELMSVLRMQDNSVDPNQPLNNLGVDSLLGTELTTRLQKNLGVEVSTFDIMRGITLKQLAEKVTEQVSGSTPSQN